MPGRAPTRRREPSTARGPPIPRGRRQRVSRSRDATPAPVSRPVVRRSRTLWVRWPRRSPRDGVRTALAGQSRPPLSPTAPLRGRRCAKDPVPPTASTARRRRARGTPSRRGRGTPAPHRRRDRCAGRRRRRTGPGLPAGDSR